MKTYLRLFLKYVKSLKENSVLVVHFKNHGLSRGQGSEL